MLFLIKMLSSDWHQGRASLVVFAFAKSVASQLCHDLTGFLLFALNRKFFVACRAWHD